MEELFGMLEKKVHTWRKRYERDLKKRYTEKENLFLMGKSKGAMDAYLDVIQIIKSIQNETGK